MEEKINKGIEGFLGVIFLFTGLFLIFPVRGINILLGSIFIGLGIIQFWVEIKKDKVLGDNKKEKIVVYPPTPEIKKAQLRVIAFKQGIENLRENGGSIDKYIDDLVIYEDMNDKAWELVRKQYPELKGKDLSYNKETNLITIRT